MHQATTSSPLSSPDSRVCVSDPEFESESTRTNSAALESPLGGTSPTVTTDRTSPDSPDDCVGEDVHAKDADAMEISGDSKMTTSIVASVDDTEIATPAKKRTRERKFWFRNLSPVRTRSSTGSLPGSSKKSQIQTPPRKVVYVTPAKPRKPRATLTPISTVKSNPRRKHKSSPTGRAQKRSRKSSALEDKQVDDDVVMSDAELAAEVDGKDGESDYEDKVKTPGLSDYGDSSPGGFYDEQDNDDNAKPVESAPRDRVKTPGISGDEASSPGGWYDDQNADPFSKRNESVSWDEVKTPGASSDEASIHGGYCGDRDTSSLTDLDESASGGGVNTPDVSDSETECLGGSQSELSVGNGSKTSVKVVSQSSMEAPDEGSSDFQARENGAEGLKESEAAISNSELKLGKINPTEYQVENIPSVQKHHHHDGVELKSKPEVSPPPKKHQDPDEGPDLEEQEAERSDRSGETGESWVEVCMSEV
ncbi:hypothetical protein HOY80DRAFT_250059 [Tuber brumale]|nr:hypothetical protein HOY80DRAFT_250059 [Tuber brumale]